MLYPPFTFFERDDSLLVNLDVDSGTGHVAGSIKEILKVVADGLDYIVTKFVEGIDWDGILASWSDGLSELKDGVGELFDAIADLFDTITKNTDEKAKSRQRSFWMADNLS